ncbi:hypothetical protein KAI87_16340 [Myxococcota bacterium]|nr:hypothetical protein [Myxococcota bacterium]
MKFNRITMVTAALFMALSLGACGEEDVPVNDNIAEPEPDTDTDTESTLGSIEITGNWDGTLTEGLDFRVSIFACPFSMPPKYYFNGTVDHLTGDVYATYEEIEPGEWCLMAYIDMEPYDSLSPVSGLDPANNTGDENSNGAVPITITAGETTVIDLTFAL